MGFLRRLLGGSQPALGGSPPSSAWPPPGPITSWPPPGGFFTTADVVTTLFEPERPTRVDAVGESYHQEAIERIAGGRTEDGAAHPDHFAVLIPEPDNAYDRNAVRVYLFTPNVGGGLVGYLSRDDAVAYRPLIDRLAAQRKVVACHASITGGWDRGDDDRGSFGVVLALDTPAVSMREVDAQEGIVPRAAVPAHAQPYASTACPSCGVALDPLPARKKACPACGQAIYVRIAPDGLRYLLGESDLAAHQARWDARNDQQAAQEASRLNNEAARMTQASLREYAESGAAFVEMSAAMEDSCAACRAVAGRQFPIREAPPIPVPGCSNDICRCDYSPVVEW